MEQRQTHGHSATGWTPVHFTEDMCLTRMVGHRWNSGCIGKRLPNHSPLMTVQPLLLPEWKVHVEIGITWFFDQVLMSIPQGRNFRIQVFEESLFWEEHFGKTWIETTKGFTTWSCTEGGQSRLKIQLQIQQLDFFTKVMVGLRTRADHGH